MRRRTFLAAATLGPFFLRAASRLPNVVFIYADDLGYGDLGSYGSKIRTPHLDRMAAEGVRFTHFYSANALCSPSRAALLTGRYPTRVGVPRVLTPRDTEGLPDDETTIARMLKAKNYKTMCIGKWHLGHLPKYLPTNRGFDSYFGIPYSNDMSPRPLLRDTKVIEPTARLDTLTQRYTDEALRFIDRSKASPFFLYFPHTFPHIPLAASTRFLGKSPLGLYGDVVEELDWSVGEVLGALKRHGVDDNTLVMFSSDNGPWYQGSPGRLRGRKGMTWEGGMREPFIARWPGRIPAGRATAAMATTMDILPTVAKLCDTPLPAKPLDGIDIFPLLSGAAADLDHDAFLYFDHVHLQCARWKQWKLHLARYNTAVWSPAPPGGVVNLPLNPPELYDLMSDPDESYDLASAHPDIVKRILLRVDEMMTTFPAGIQQAYRDTKARNSQSSPAGALPKGFA